MSKITHIDSARPHIEASIECGFCNHAFHASYPENANYIKCPDCHGFVNEYGTAVFVNTCKKCNREFSLCPMPTEENIKHWDNCLADDCASYDPKRDADKLFEQGLVKRDDDE